MYIYIVYTIYSHAHVLYVQYIVFEYVYMYCPGSDTAKLLISTDSQVSESNLDGTNTVPVSTIQEVIDLTKESSGMCDDDVLYLYICVMLHCQGIHLLISKAEIYC